MSINWEEISEKRFTENPKSEFTEMLFDTLFSNDDFPQLDIEKFGDENVVCGSNGVIEFVYNDVPFTILVGVGNTL